MQFRYTVNYCLPFLGLKLTSSPQNMLFASQGTVPIWENFMRPGRAILGKPNRKALLGAHHRICLPDVWIVLVNLFMNLVYRNGLCVRKAARPLPLNSAQKKIKRQTGTGSTFCGSVIFLLSGQDLVPDDLTIVSSTLQSTNSKTNTLSIICQSSREAENSTLWRLKCWMEHRNMFFHLSVPFQLLCVGVRVEWANTDSNLRLKIRLPWGELHMEAAAVFNTSIIYLN